MHFIDVTRMTIFPNQSSALMRFPSLSTDP
jgi:hypothetical protein